jgi:hypothetical protein
VNELDQVTEFVNRQAREAKMAYDIFRGSYRATEVPHWNDLPVWIRDALIHAHKFGEINNAWRMKDRR